LIGDTSRPPAWWRLSQRRRCEVCVDRTRPSRSRLAAACVRHAGGRRNPSSASWPYRTGLRRHPL